MPDGLFLYNCNKHAIQPGENMFTAVEIKFTLPRNDHRNTSFVRIVESYLKAGTRIARVETKGARNMFLLEMDIHGKLRDLCWLPTLILEQ